MLYIQSFVFNPFQENTYIIYNDEKQCWIVDPGMHNTVELRHFTDYISEHKLVPQSIINTHAHIDHIFGVAAVTDLYKIPFGIHEKDLPVLNSAQGAAAMFGFDFGAVPKADFYIKDNNPLPLGEDEVDVRFVPGHSPGSVAFYYKPGNWVIAGDALFNGSIGRTDLPGGNHNQLITSIKTQLLMLPEETRVHSGHGPYTTIGAEKSHNPFLTE